MDLPLGQSDMSFPRLNSRKYSPDDGAGAAFAKYFLAKNSRTHNLLRTGDSIPLFFQPLP
jgi:hypothetical protein